MPVIILGFRFIPRTAALFSALWFLVGLTVSAAAQSVPPTEAPSAQARRVEQAPVLDGRVLDDPVWKDLPPLTEFWQSAPDAGQPSSEATAVRIAYTDDAIYFGVVLWDASPSGLTISDSRRDASLDDADSFRIVLDTFRDRQNGFVFGTNPAALEYDGQINNEGGATNPLGNTRQQSGSGGGFNLNWDGAWNVRTTTFAGGWSAEFEIPFRTLRYAPGSGREWGVNFMRTIRRRNETAYWAPLPIQFDLFRVSLAGSLRGLDLPVPRNLKLIPFTVGEARTRDGGSTRLLGDVGLDAKYSLTPSLTLDATINTDFAQVEVDEQQINLDRFNLFFPEKRPFFLENAGLFAVGSPSEAELFFSRRIGIANSGEPIPIVGGARLSGRTGPVNVGLLNMQTDAVPGVPETNFTVGRVRREFRGRSNVGAIYVGREATSEVTTGTEYNRAIGADGRWGIGSTGLIAGFVARTFTPGVSRDQHAFQVQGRNETQLLTVSATYTETGRNFNPEVGFLSRPGGFQKIEASAFSRLRPTGSSIFQEFRPHTIYRGFWDPDGVHETGFWHVDNHTEFKNGSEIHTGVNFTHEGVVDGFEIYPGVFVPPGSYDHHDVQLVFQSNDGAAVFGRMQVTAGGFFGGDRVALGPQIRVRIGDTFSTDIGWEHNDIDLPGGSFDTNLTRARVSYSFTPRVFAQSLVQYNDRANTWSTNLRFGWLQQANTGIFIVYTDSHFIDDPQLIPRTTDRSLIIKFSRMFDVLN